jgi:hypothetical protein
VQQKFRSAAKIARLWLRRTIARAVFPSQTFLARFAVAAKIGHAIATDLG